MRFYLNNKLETINQIKTYYSKALSSATISETSRLCSFIAQATGHLMESHRAIRQDELFDHCSPALEDINPLPHEPINIGFIALIFSWDQIKRAE